MSLKKFESIEEQKSKKKNISKEKSKDSTQSAEEKTYDCAKKPLKNSRLENLGFRLARKMPVQYLQPPYLAILLGLLESASKNDNTMEELTKTIKQKGGSLHQSITNLIQDVKKKEDKDLVFKTFINNKTAVEKTFKFFNDITADDLNALQSLSELFTVQILVYRNSMTVPESYTPKLASEASELKFHLTLQWDEGRDYCLLLYKDEAQSDLEVLNKRLAENLLNVKLGEVKLIEALTGDNSSEFKIADDIFKELEDDLNVLKKTGNEKLLNQLQKYLSPIKNPATVNTAIENFMRKKKDKMAVNDKDNCCLICFKSSLDQLVFICSHKICRGCYNNALTKRYKEDLVLSCIFPGCLHVLSKEEQKLISIAFPDKVEGNKEKCGMCNKTVEQVSIRLLHEKHGLCKKCLKAYVEEITEGAVYVYTNGIGNLKKHPCPFRGCDKKFECELAMDLYTFEENQELLRISRKAFAMVT